MTTERQFAFELKSKTPLLIHADDVEKSDQVKQWRDDKTGKDSPAGDDRYPPWTWQTYLYEDNGILVIPTENLMKGLRQAASSIKVGKGAKTFKSMSQSGIFMEQEFWPILVNGKPVSTERFDAIWDEPFSVQRAEVKKMGYDLLVKRAVIKTGYGKSKHVRVRLKLLPWSVRGTILVNEKSITTNVLEEMFHNLARHVGLMDWRPGSPDSPGNYGICESKVTAMNGK